MNYEILETRIEFKNNQLHRITVLVNCTAKGNPHTKPYTDVRAIFATTQPRGGYIFLSPSQQVNADLFQKVAASGMETSDRDKIFSNWKKNLFEHQK